MDLKLLFLTFSTICGFIHGKVITFHIRTYDYQLLLPTNQFLFQTLDLSDNDLPPLKDGSDVTDKTAPCNCKHKYINVKQII